MAKLLSDLANRLVGSRDGIQPSTQAFPPLDVRQIASELHLEERGQGDGRDEQPPSDGEVPSIAEADIRAEIENRARKSAEEYRSQLALYDGRIEQALASVEVRPQLEAAGQGALTDLKILSTNALRAIREARRFLGAQDRELEEFRVANRLNRLPRRVSRLDSRGRWALLAILFLAEMALNSAFFAEASEFGLVGGAIQAGAFSLLNVAGSLAYAAGGLPLLRHHRTVCKVVGVAASMVFAFWLVGWNLLTGIFRDLYIQHVDVVTIHEIVSRLAAAHFSVSDPNSWVLRDGKSLTLFTLGIATGLLAVVDSFGLKDPYLGYGRLGTLRDQALQHYNEEIKSWLDSLTSLRDEAISSMAQVILELRRYDFDLRLAIDGRDRLHRAYVAYLGHLIDSHARLQREYQAANTKARSSPVPTRFRSATPAPAFLTEPAFPELSDSRKEERVACIGRMEHFIVAVNQQFETEVRQLEALDAGSGKE